MHIIITAIESSSIKTWWTEFLQDLKAFETLFTMYQ